MRPFPEDLRALAHLLAGQSQPKGYLIFEGEGQGKVSRWWLQGGDGSPHKVHSEQAKLTWPDGTPVEV